jgi:hypothetical protein
VYAAVTHLASADVWISATRPCRSRRARWSQVDVTRSSSGCAPTVAPFIEVAGGGLALAGAGVAAVAGGGVAAVGRCR